MSQQEVSVPNDDFQIPPQQPTTTTTINNTTSNNLDNIESNKPSTMISVKDFAYDEDEELHYGVGNYSQYLTDEEYDYDSNNEYYDEEVDEDEDEVIQGGEEFDELHDDENQSSNQRRHVKQNKRKLKNSIINIPKNYYFEDGPPWKEDPDLKTPMIKDDSKNEFEFSISSSDEIHGKAIALFDFTPENDNEVGLKEGQIIWISYRHGQGWLVAEDSNTGETGLVPEEYVQLVNDVDLDDEPKRFLPNIINDEDQDHESDWIDEDDDELPNVQNLSVDDK